MKIIHFSDLHGMYQLIGGVKKPDLWICTGDFFPNFTNPMMDKKTRLGVEREKQAQWLSDNLDDLNKMLRDVPIFWTNGNHDFIKPFGIKNMTYLEEGVYGEFNGLKFAGFPEVPKLSGYWNGEVGIEEMIRICRSVFSQPFQVLLTHTPPVNILDNVSYYGYESTGSQPLREYIFESDVMLHCFGHIHEQGGKTREMAGVVFSNAATTFNIIEA